MECPACYQDMTYLRDEVVDGILRELHECPAHGIMSPRKGEDNESG